MSYKPNYKAWDVLTLLTPAARCGLIGGEAQRQTDKVTSSLNYITPNSESLSRYQSPDLNAFDMCVFKKKCLKKNSRGTLRG